jgi:hypothetical protein
MSGHFTCQFFFFFCPAIITDKKFFYRHLPGPKNLYGKIFAQQLSPIKIFFMGILPDPKICMEKIFARQLSLIKKIFIGDNCRAKNLYGKKVTFVPKNFCDYFFFFGDKSIRLCHAVLLPVFQQF